MSVRVAAVVVAWNRADILRDTVAALGCQERKVDDIIVVDNASTDSTPEFLAQSEIVDDVITMPENFGGAGGFAAGIARAVSRGADYVWIMDDDTVPTPKALSELLASLAKYPDEPAIMACRADWFDGREHPMNKPRTRFGMPKRMHAEAKKAGARQIRTASFVAIMIDAQAVREEGLPIADYFLWNDDFEYTARLLRKRIGLYVDAARVEHRTKVFGNSTADPGPRFFNEVRNKIWVFGSSHGLSPLEKLLFGGKTLLRWAKMMLKSGDRKAMLGYLRDGIAAGCKCPRRNSEVLAGTPVADEVTQIERGAGNE